MSTNNNSNVETDSPSYSVKFVLLMTLQIPSILVSLLIFAHFVSSRKTRAKDYQHSTFVLLAINFLQVITDLPMPMSFFHSGGIVRPATAAYCIWWVWYEFSLNTVNGFLMAWISIERHLLIFHAHLIRGVGTWKRWLLHVAPLIVCSLWGPLFYLMTVVFPPMCDNTWLFDRLFCGQPCYLTTHWGSFDLFFDVISPVAIIVFANLALVARVVCQRMNITGRTRINWRRRRRMIIQLSLISSIYLAVWIPVSVVQLGQIYIDPTFHLAQLDIVNYLVYFVPLILPVICLISMPQFFKKLKIRWVRRHPNAIMPIAAIFLQNVARK